MKSPLEVEVTVHHAPGQPALPLGLARASAQVQRWFSSLELRGARCGRPRGVFLLPQVREVFSVEGFAWI